MAYIWSRLPAGTVATEIFLLVIGCMLIERADLLTEIDITILSVVDYVLVYVLLRFCI